MPPQERLTVPIRGWHFRPLLVFVVFAALSVLWTWPLATHLGSRVAFDPGDPVLNTWILWWNTQAIPFTREWWNPPIFYPMRGALALSEHLAGIGFFTTPLIRLGATPALAYNTALLLSYVLSGFFAYLLVMRLTGSEFAALCTGLAFAFAPFRAGQLSHLQVLTAQWLPLELLGLHAYMNTRRRRWLVVFGGAWILQGLSNGYYLLFAPVLVTTWICWFIIAQRRWIQAGEIILACILASLPLLPILLTYRNVQNALGLVRTRAEIVEYSGRLHSFLNPPPMLAVWPVRNVQAVEDFLFPGITMVTVIAVALVFVFLTRHRGGVQRSAHVFLFYVFAALFMGALTLGPAVTDTGALRWLKPYEWLLQLPGFNGVRVPVRFAMLMALCLSISGGLGLAMILPVARRGRALVGAIVTLGIFVDGFMEPVGASRPPGRLKLPNVLAAAVLELPPDDSRVSIAAMFRAISHRLPLINGFSGYIPPHYRILSQSLRRGDPSGVMELARGKSLFILVEERNDPTGDYRRLVESIPGIERLQSTGVERTYLLRPLPANRKVSAGTPYPFTATQLPRSHVVLDLNSPRVLRTFEFQLRDRFFDLGHRVAIETSLNGVDWQIGWEDWTGGAALNGALEDQIRVPIRLMLPDILARYVRIHPAEAWLIKELRVLGP